MGTLTSLMHTSLSAMQADQAALDVTAKNVANQNTIGYTRQVVQFQTNDIVTLSGSVGGGVNIGNGPVSQRDRVLEQRVQQQTQTQAQSAAVASAMQQVESVFSISSKPGMAATTVLGAATDAFFGSLASLANNPADTATRQQVLSAAGSMAGAFNLAAQQISTIGSGLDQEVGSIVGQVNGLTATIAGLNGQIAQLTPGGDAGTLEDQRQAAIAKLSQYIGTSQISSDHNGITLTTMGGEMLVGGNAAYALSMAQVGAATRVVNGAGSDVTSEISGGALGGILVARGTILPAVATALDVLANAIATQVNSQNVAGIDENGSAGKPLFVLSGGVAGAAGSISVATSDPRLVAAASIGEGSTGNTNAQAMADLATAKIAAGSSVPVFYGSLLYQVGSEAAAATSDATQQGTLLAQITSQRDGLSGVSLDQEAANLTQYQRSYEAAARVFSIVNTLMANAINLGQGTSVS